MAQSLPVDPPPQIQAAVRQAITAAFGASQPDRISPVGGGASGALPFKVELGDQRFLVRIEGERSPLRNPHQYQAMRIAAEAGIAPRVHHIDEAAGIAVMDFVED